MRPSSRKKLDLDADVVGPPMLLDNGGGGCDETLVRSTLKSGTSETRSDSCSDLYVLMFAWLPISRCIESVEALRLSRPGGDGLVRRGRPGPVSMTGRYCRYEREASFFHAAPFVFSCEGGDPTAVTCMAGASVQAQQSRGEWRCRHLQLSHIRTIAGGRCAWV